MGCAVCCGRLGAYLGGRLSVGGALSRATSKAASGWQCVATRPPAGAGSIAARPSPAVRSSLAPGVSRPFGSRSLGPPAAAQPARSAYLGRGLRPRFPPALRALWSARLRPAALPYPLACLPGLAGHVAALRRPRPGHALRTLRGLRASLARPWGAAPHPVL